MKPAATNQRGNKGTREGTANAKVLPSLAAVPTGPLSTVERSPAGEQDLDSIKAGKIEPRQGQDRTSPQSVLTKPPSEFMPGKAKRAADIMHVTLKSHANRRNQAAGPAMEHNVAIAGMAARAWQTAPSFGVLSQYCPPSWHHPTGILKILRKIEPRLPDVSHKLFLTLSLDPKFFAGPDSAFDFARPRIRKLFAKLRKGVGWEGKTYQIDEAYCVKVEFHENGWPHFHLIVLTNRYLPGALINDLWELGRCNVERINNQKFRYLLKYVTKNGEYPDWVKERRRLRVFQPSHGFMKPVDEPKASKPAPAASEADPAKLKRRSYSLGERLKRWARMALLNEDGRFRTIVLVQPFQQIFDAFILSIAEAHRYLGNGFIKINNRKQLIPWTGITQTNNNLASM